MNQLGDYFDTIEGGTVDEPVGSHGADDVFTAVQPVLRRAAAGASPDGIGRALGDVLSVSPLVRDLKRLRQDNGARYSAAAGFGQASSPPPTPLEPVANTGMLVVAVLTGAIVRGIAGYYVGKAVAPSQQVEKKYAWWGVPTAIVFGALGMGVEAGIALSKR